VKAIVPRLLAIALAWAALPLAPARACTLAEEYYPPSNYEAIQKAAAIVIATARGSSGGDFLSQVTFDVDQTLKGSAPAKIGASGYLREAKPLRRADPGEPVLVGLGGPCGGGSYEKGRKYILLVEKDEAGEVNSWGVQGLQLTDAPRGSELAVPLRTVRRYLRLQASKPPMEQLSTLWRLQRTGLGLDGERLRPAEVADIRDHLSSVSPWKPTPFLIAVYQALESGEHQGEGAAPREWNPQWGARYLLDSKRREGGFVPAYQRRRVLLALATGDHPDARPMFESMIAERPGDPGKIGLALRFLARNGAYGRAFAWIEGRLMNLLPQLERRAALRLVADVDRAQRGDGEGREPWRSDPHASAAWPELALSLYGYQVRSFGADEATSFGDALRELPHSDYRARPLLTLALAQSYEEGVADWAIAELRDERKRKAFEALSEEARGEAEDPARLPLQVLLSAWQQAHGAVLREVFCQSSARRRLLIRTIGDTADSLYSGLIEAIAASPLDDEERALLPAALVRWSARTDRMSDPGDLDHPILVDVVGGKKLAGNGIPCPGETIRPQ